MSFAIGQVVADKYEIVDELGKGGMGTVFRAKHLTLHRDVAVKTLHEQYATEEEHRLRFEREARVAAAFEHDSAISIYDFGSQDGVVYIVMELLSGATISQLMKKGEPIDYDLGIALAWQTSDALVEAHHIGLVHRDLKPSNIMVETRSDGSQRAVVVDFGLAFLQRSEELARLTQQGVVTGTPAYLSPEQAQGGDIGAASDVYSFGCVLHKMFTGHQLFRGSTIELLTRHVLKPAPSPMRTYPDADIPPALDSLILSMLAKDPEERPSIIKVREWLGALAEKKSPRNRGKPERFLAERDERAVTHAMHNALTPAARAPVAGERPIAVVGAIDEEWDLALQYAGFRIVEVTEEESAQYPVTLTLSDELLEVEALCKTSDVIVVSGAGMEHVTSLLRAGAKDIVTAPIERGALVKKVERVWKKSKRKSE